MLDYSNVRLRCGMESERSCGCCFPAVCLSPLWWSIISDEPTRSLRQEAVDGAQKPSRRLIGAIMKTNDKSLVLVDVSRCSSAHIYHHFIDQLLGEITS